MSGSTDAMFPADAVSFVYQIINFPSSSSSPLLRKTLYRLAQLQSAYISMSRGNIYKSTLSRMYVNE